MDQLSITKFWIKTGKHFPKGNIKITPTSRDPYLGQLETENFLDFIRTSDSILEIGCGDGQHTIRYAQKAKEIFALDVAEDLIKIANHRVEKTKIKNLHLGVGSVINLEKIVAGKKFDQIISQRLLINMANWKTQKNIIKQIYNILRPGGKLLLSEGFIEGFRPLNKIRKDLNLGPIVPVAYNCNFIRQKFENFVNHYFEIREVRDYGLYLFLSRTITPLLSFPRSPRHDSKLNEAFMKLAKIFDSKEMVEYSYNLFYVLRKK